MAAKAEGFHYIGIEREPEYVEIAKRRIDSVSNLYHCQQTVMECV